MPFKQPAQQAAFADEEPCLDTLWTEFAQEVENIHKHSTQDGDMPVQHALRQILAEFGMGYVW